MQNLPSQRTTRPERAAPLEAFSRTEKIIAFCRVLLATATLALSIVDPKQPSFRPEASTWVLGLYLIYSLALFAIVRAERVRQDRIGYVSTVIDVVCLSLITLLMEGGPSPFFMLHVFVISSVSVRWGLVATVAVTVVLATIYPALGYAAGVLVDPDTFGFQRGHFVRSTYLLVLGYLIGYLGEHERRSKRKLAFLLDLTAAVRRDRPLGRSLTQLMRRALRFFDAQRAHVVLRDPDSGRFFLWDLVIEGGRARVGLRITGEDPLAFPFVRDTEGFLANDPRGERGGALCYDILTGVMERRAIPADFAFPIRTPQAMLVAPVLIRHELRGRAVILRDSHRKFTRDDLEFLLVLASQAGVGFETVRLQQKAGEVAVLEERARIARDLHDGFIQSLAGIDLRVEACKMWLQRDPSRIAATLDELHQVVEGGYREVRQYLTMLRGSMRGGLDLSSTLERLAAEFSIRERVHVHLARPQSDPGLPATTTHELAQIVREALHNAIRHGRATQAVIKFGARPSHVYLVVRDNGKGFPAATALSDSDGFVSAGHAPWSIRERTSALGGSLRIWSQPGRGTEIAVMIPVSGTVGSTQSVGRATA